MVRMRVKKVDGSKPSQTARLDRVDGVLAIAIACAALAAYVATLCPTIYTEDSAEFSTAIAVFGIPHPPGYPLYTLLAALFARVVSVGDMAYRSNLFSAVCGAAALSALWLLLRRLDRGRMAALAAVLCLGCGGTFWSQCLVAEVHSFNCLLLVLALLTAVVAADKPTARSFLLCGATAGLLVVHRNMNVIFWPALWAVVESGRRRARADVRLLGFAAISATAAGLFYLYVPLAASRNPPLNIGAPVTLPRLYDVISAQPYFRHFASGTLGTDLGRLWAFVKRSPTDVGLAALAAPLGFMIWRRQAQRAAGGSAKTSASASTNNVVLPLALLAVFSGCVAFSTLYNVLDVDVYFLPAHVVLVIFAAFAFDAVVAWRPAAGFVLPVLGLLALPLNYRANDLRHTHAAANYARDLLRSAPARAILISFGDTSDHVLGYAQAVCGQRPDVVTISANQISDWYREQLRARYADVAWPAADIAETSDWFVSLARANVHGRPFCLTHPLGLGLVTWSGVPRGLLTCLYPRDETTAIGRALTESVAFWRDTNAPSRAEAGEHADVHIHMVAFAYATARFALARALGDAGDIDGARAQLLGLLAMNPDEHENTIVAAMASVGRRPARPFALGDRARRASAAGPADAAALRAALAGGP